MLDSCHNCHRPLTSELSRKRGLGPTCWRTVNNLPAPKKRVAPVPAVEYDPNQLWLFECQNVCEELVQNKNQEE
jgi:hypothetical protein